MILRTFILKNLRAAAIDNRPTNTRRYTRWNTTDDCIIMSSLNERLCGSSARWTGMAGKWEMQVQNVNKRAPEGMLYYIYI